MSKFSKCLLILVFIALLSYVYVNSEKINNQQYQSTNLVTEIVSFTEKPIIDDAAFPESSTNPITTTILETTTKKNSEIFDATNYLFESSYDGWVYATSGVLKAYAYPDTNCMVKDKIYNQNLVTVVGETNFFYILDYNSSLRYVIKEDTGIKGIKKSTILKKLEPTFSNSIHSSSLKLISTAITPCSSSKNRDNNLLVSSVATSIVINPGEIFSFNQATDPRTKQAGYLSASTYDSSGNVTSGIGGGVCQTASTIHMAVIYAIDLGFEFEDLESHLHSAPVSYLSDRSMEAMVNWGWSDFKFKNNSSSSIAIIVNFENSTLTANIYEIV